MYTTEISRHINAPRSAVYRALLDAGAIAKWRVPAGMSGHVHEFDAREGGVFRVSLMYDAPTGTGKSAAHTGTYRGHFVEFVPNERVVEVLAFETADPALRGTMRRPSGLRRCTKHIVSIAMTSQCLVLRQALAGHSGHLALELHHQYPEVHGNHRRSTVSRSTR